MRFFTARINSLGVILGGISVTTKENVTDSMNFSRVFRVRFEQVFPFQILLTQIFEHVLNSLQELRELRSVLNSGGLAVFYVPCETYRLAFNQND